MPMQDALTQSQTIQKILHDYFALNATVKRLPGETDLNYFVETKDNQRYLLKISHQAESLENIEFQNAMIEHLKQKNLNVTSLVATIDNKKYLTSHNRFIRLFTWLEGRVFASVNPQLSPLMHSLGKLCGEMSLALSDFDHPAAHRYLKWDPSQVEWTKQHIHLLNVEQQSLVKHFYSLFETHALPLFSVLRKSVNYNDANDYNVLVSHEFSAPIVQGVIDFGDAVYTHTINELAIAVTYAMLGKQDPLQTACDVIKGYHAEFPLKEEEIQVLFAMIGARLIISLTCAVMNAHENPQNTYLQISYQPVLELMKKIAHVPNSLAYHAFRDACHLEPNPQNEVFQKWINEFIHEKNFPIELDNNFIWLDLSVGSLDLGNFENVKDKDSFEQTITQLMRYAKTSTAVSRYHEARLIENDETTHLGVDFFTLSPAEIKAVCAGEVHYSTKNKLMLKHVVSNELTFYSCYSFIDANLPVGQKIKKGEIIGKTTQLNFQFHVMLDLIGVPFVRTVNSQQSHLWKSISPDPWLLFCGQKSPKISSIRNEKIIEYRKQHLGKNMSIAYREPIKMVRGHMQYLYDENGRRYLDTVNNVPHVGHENSRVVRAGQRQMAVLNTNTRYLHDTIIHFTDKLLATLPPKLNVAFIVNSGSEANELALRLAKNFTGQKDMLVCEVGYHGNTNACVDISSYKFDGPGGNGASSFVHVTPLPDCYRGKYRDENAGEKYASHIDEAIQKIQQQNRKPAAFICESIISCGGQIVLPKNYLLSAYQFVRNAGGICIADEVQTGCGRTGDYFWAFEQQGVVPDIVTIGKPIGNGHPLAVVVTTQEIADAFKNGMEYFNTFGGNPVSCAIGLEVLNVIQEENLQHHAKNIGEYLTRQLQELQSRYALIGDVRGPGLFVGMELVRDRHTLEPATAEATYLVNRMRDKGILMSTDGPFNNVIKIKPPLVIGQQDMDFLIESLNDVLQEDFLK
jgi:4-aminobutyrate aminotransferase-like enzyme/Ser/Thr protein kinase RdoA (MazF antagonist)